MELKKNAILDYSFIYSYNKSAEWHFVYFWGLKDE